MKKNLFILLLIPVFALLSLTGCGEKKTITDVKTLYEEMVTDNASLFNDSIVDITYGEAVFNIESLSDETLNGIELGDDLKVAYLQLNNLYERLLQVPSAYYNTYKNSIYDNVEVLDLSEADVNSLYNKLVTLKKSFNNLKTEKESIEQKATLSSGSSVNLIQRIHSYNYEISLVMDSYFDFVNEFADLVEKHASLQVSVLDGDASDADKLAYINRLVARAELNYAYTVYYENIKAFSTVNNCDTLSLEYIDGDSLVESEFSLISQLNAIISNRVLTSVSTIDENCIANAKVLNTLNIRYEQMQAFYIKSFGSIDYYDYTVARVRDLENSTADNMTNFELSLTSKQKASLYVVEDFIKIDTVGFAEALQNLI